MPTFLAMCCITNRSGVFLLQYTVQFGQNMLKSIGGSYKHHSSDGFMHNIFMCIFQTQLHIIFEGKGLNCKNGSNLTAKYQKRLVMHAYVMQCTK